MSTTENTLLGPIPMILSIIHNQIHVPLETSYLLNNRYLKLKLNKRDLVEKLPEDCSMSF